MTGVRVNILLVEDNDGDVRLLKEMLNEARPGEFEVAVADRLDKIAAALLRERIDVLLLDLGLPDSRGIETFDKTHAQAPALPIVVLTGLHDNEIGLTALKRGAQDYLIKGQVDGTLLARAVRYAIERKQIEKTVRESQEKLKSILDSSPSAITVSDLRGIITDCNEKTLKMHGCESKDELIGRDAFEFIAPEDRERAQENMKKTVAQGIIEDVEYRMVTRDGRTFPAELSAGCIRDSTGKPTAFVAVTSDITDRKSNEEKLRVSLQKLKRAFLGTINALGKTIEKRDPYTASHQQRVTNLACRIAKTMSLPEDRIEAIRVAGILHDIGKIYVPAEILSKPTELTKPEFDIIKTHAAGGKEILESVEFPWPIAEIIVQHHERTNGSGYPAGIKGNAMLLEAKILAVADVVEAMSSHRPYRPARGIPAAIEEITRNRDVLYDAAVVDACLTVVNGKEFAFER